jgi:hypothetical protein
MMHGDDLAQGTGFQTIFGALGVVMLMNWFWFINNYLILHLQFM